MSVQRHQHIFWFEIPIDYIVVVQERKPFHNFWNQLPDDCLIEVLLRQVVVQITAFNIFHDDVDFMWVLEGIDDVHQIRMVSLTEHLLNEIGLQQILFLDA